MGGKARSRRDDRHIDDERREMMALVDGLSDSQPIFEIDAPSDARGEWWIDLAFDGFKTQVAWRSDRGFGIFTSNASVYGDRPDEVYREADLAAKRLLQLARRPRDAGSPMHLREMRTLLNQSQTVIAERLKKGQSFISRLEKQDDALLSTVRDYVEALGGTVGLVVHFDGFDAPVSLPRKTGSDMTSSRLSEED